MEQLQGQEFLCNFLKDIEKAKALTIISPYINDFAVKKMQQVLINNKGIKNCNLLHFLLVLNMLRALYSRSFIIKNHGI